MSAQADVEMADRVFRNKVFTPGRKKGLLPCVAKSRFHSIEIVSDRREDDITLVYVGAVAEEIPQVS
jgi:hypothetical protein